MIQNLAKITFKQIDDSIAEDAFLFVSEVFAMRSTLHRAINIEIDLCRDYLKAGYQQAIDQGLSIVAVDESEQEICGMLIAKDIMVSGYDNAGFAGQKTFTNHKIIPKTGRNLFCAAKN